MKNVKFLLVFASALLILTSCYRVKPDPGFEAVLVAKPMIFGHGGVFDEPVSTGATWCVFTTDYMLFPITPVTFTEDFVNMVPSDRTPVNFSVYPKIQIQQGKSPLLYEYWGVDWYVNNIMAPFRTMVRDRASQYTMFDLASKREISAQLEDELFKELSELISNLKNKDGETIPLLLENVTIGAITPPDQVLTETKNTAAQNQSKLTQEARAQAELARMQAEKNKAIADKAYMQEMGMNTDQYIHIRTVEIEKEKVELVRDFKGPLTIFFGSGNNSGANPSYPLK